MVVASAILAENLKATSGARYSSACANVGIAATSIHSASPAGKATGGLANIAPFARAASKRLTRFNHLNIQLFPGFCSQPLQISWQTRRDGHGNDFWHIVGMHCLDDDFQFRVTTLYCLDDQGHFIGLLDGALPLINRLYRRHDVDACR